MAMRVAVMSLVFGAGLACSSGDAQLETASGTIEFPETVVGELTTMFIAIDNVGGTTTEALALSTTGDFEIKIGPGMARPAIAMGKCSQPAAAAASSSSSSPRGGGPRWLAGDHRWRR